ncbi:MAG: PAS domain S-box protein, partial [Nitrospira sp.]|nr:PAS domain S-box protein [Nitrospira sp.]
MQAPPFPADETVRLDTLYRCEILDTPPEPSFDGLVDLAAAICVAPIALVTLIDPTRQWFKSKIGLSVSETPRDIAFCAHTILGREVFIVEDANADVRFADNPLVTGDPYIRFYAGAPIVLSDGTALGTVAVIDTVSRRLSVKQMSLLTKLAGQAAALLESRKEMRSFEQGLRIPGHHLHYVDLGFRVGMWEWEPSTGRLAWTPHLEELYGVAIGSVRHYEDWRRSVHPDDLVGVEGKRDEAVRNHRPFDLEFRIVLANGDIRWVSSRGSAKYDQSGNPVLVMGNTHDITVLKDTEAALQVSRRQLQAIVEGTTDAVFIKDLQGRYLHFNGAAERFVGKCRDEVIGRDDRYIFSPADAQAVMEADRTVITGGVIMTYEDVATTVDGVQRTFLSTKGPLTDDQCRVIGLFGIARDITERKQAEEQLRESEERFRSIFEHAGTGIAITDLEGRFLRCNPAYCAILGYTEAELCGLNFKQVVHPEDLATNLVVADRLCAQEVLSFKIENRSRHKDGHDVWVHKFVSLLRDDSGQPTAMFTLVTDITERHRMHEVLEQRVAERTEELRVSEVFNREVLDSLSAHVAVLDATGLIVAVNRVWEKAALLNNPSGLAQVGCGANYVKVCERAADKSSDAQETLQGILDVLEGRAHVFETEYVCIWPGHHQWFSMRVTPLCDRGGCVIVHED